MLGNAELQNTDR